MGLYIYIWIWDCVGTHNQPVVSRVSAEVAFEGMIEVDDESSTDHFESVQRLGEAMESAGPACGYFYVVWLVVIHVDSW